MNMEIVNSYVERLRAALGDAAAFAVVYVEMENDQAVRQPEAVGIAKSFYGDASSKLAKSEAFRRIRGRQNAIMDNRAKATAQAGKSAA